MSVLAIGFLIAVVLWIIGSLKPELTESQKHTIKERLNLFEKYDNTLSEVFTLKEDLRDLHLKINSLDQWSVNSFILKNKFLLKCISDMDKKNPLHIIADTNLRLNNVKAISEQKEKYGLMSDSEREDAIKKQSFILFAGIEELEKSIFFMKKLKTEMSSIIQIVEVTED